jgi:hypothetical protein
MGPSLEKDKIISTAWEMKILRTVYGPAADQGARRIRII